MKKQTSVARKVLAAIQAVNRINGKYGSMHWVEVANDMVITSI